MNMLQKNVVCWIFLYLYALGPNTPMPGQSGVNTPGHAAPMPGQSGVNTPGHPAPTSLTPRKVICLTTLVPQTIFLIHFQPIWFVMWYNWLKDKIVWQRKNFNAIETQPKLKNPLQNFTEYFQLSLLFYYSLSLP